MKYLYQSYCNEFIRYSGYNEVKFITSLVTVPLCEELYK